MARRKKHHPAAVVALWATMGFFTLYLVNYVESQMPKFLGVLAAGIILFMGGTVAGSFLSGDSDAD